MCGYLHVQFVRCQCFFLCLLKNHDVYCAKLTSSSMIFVPYEKFGQFGVGVHFISDLGSIYCKSFWSNFNKLSLNVHNNVMYLTWRYIKWLAQIQCVSKSILKFLFCSRQILAYDCGHSLHSKHQILYNKTIFYHTKQSKFKEACHKIIL